MASESIHGAHSVVATLQPAIILLGLGIVVALVSRACRLNPIVGYLGLGLGIAAFGQADAFSGPLVAALAEAGVMFLLFNLGLHFSLGRIRAEAGNIFGFGSLQMLIAGGAFAALFYAIGLPPAFAVIAGFAMGLSSTAVVIGLIRERDQQDCPVGRAAQSILIFQDIAAIALLVSAGALGGASDSMAGELGSAAIKALIAFGVAVLFARTLVGPLFRLIGRADSSEVFTATALFLALAAGWATGAAGLSLTLGAFLGGMAVADSRYRIMVQAEIEAFRGLFLSFFFISVGLSLDPQVLVANWGLVLAAATGLIVVKCGLNIVAALANRWSVPGSIQLGFLLGQGSEFALVLLALPALAGMVEPRLVAILVTAIAISLALTPPVSEIGRRLAGKLRQGPADDKLAGDDAPVVIIGMGEAGRALADALDYNDLEYLAVEQDNDRFERALADGYSAHRADPRDPRSWDSLGMRNRELVVLTAGDLAVVRELQPLVEERMPSVTTLVSVSSERDAALFEALGVRAAHDPKGDGFERLVDSAFAHFGRPRRPQPPGYADRAGSRTGSRTDSHVRAA